MLSKNYNTQCLYCCTFLLTNTNSAIGVKKMIVSQLISSVRVSVGYKIEIDFTISEKHFGLDRDHEQAAEHTPKQKKRRTDPEL